MKFEFPEIKKVSFETENVANLWDADATVSGTEM
jgi:hypothetical protein